VPPSCDIIPPTGVQTGQEVQRDVSETLLL